MEILESIEAAPVRADELAREGQGLYLAVCSYPAPASQQEAQLYAEDLLQVKDRRHFIKAERLKITGPLRAALSAANAHFDRADAPFESIELVLKGLLGQWDMEQRKRQEAEQRALEAEAQAERQRLRAEADEREREALAAAKDAPEAAGLLAQESAELRQAALELAAPVVPEVHKIAGISHRGTWKLRVVDEEAMRDYCHTHREFRGLFPYDPKIGDALARSLKDKLRMPGVEVQFIPVVAAGRRAGR
jgi:hypothetical protein